MKSLFKSIFHSDKTEPSTRILDDPRKLIAGDLITLDDGFGMPSMLRGETFEVRQVNTCQFEHKHSPEFVLKGKDTRSVFLSIEEEDGEEYAAFSVKIERSTVEQLFDLDDFARIFDSEEQAQFATKDHDISFLEGFLGQHYRQEGSGALRGYYYENKDYRNSRPPSYEGAGEAFDWFYLISDDENFAIEIEVWESGETDVSLTVYKHLTDIKELWPGEGREK